MSIELSWHGRQVQLAGTWGWLTPRLGLLTADLRGTPAVLVLARLTAPSALSCLGALGLSAKLQKGSSDTLGIPPPLGLQTSVCQVLRQCGHAAEVQLSRKPLVPN